jgi:response regulator RpfG family c-di-GMP phosphodiesterase
MSDQEIRPVILVADDEPVHLLMMEELLVDNGYDVITAEDGLQAYERTTRAMPDLILLDILMPKMDGYDVCLKLKNNPLTEDIPIIFVTGKADDLDETIGFEYGAVDYIRKPITASTMIARVQNHLAILEAAKQLQEMLSKTLLGSIRVLNDILILIDPTFHSMLPRLKRYVVSIATYLDLPGRWRLELAAMLSHIGCAAIPKEVLKNISAGKNISEEDQKMFDMHPKIAQDLISKIPRLKSVARMIGNQQSSLDKSKLMQELSKWDRVDLGAQLLKMVIDFDRMVTSGLAEEKALSEMRAKEETYSPALLDALEAVAKVEQKGDVQLLMFKELQEGHVLKQDLYTKSGALVVKKGKVMSTNTITLLRPFADTQGIEEPIKVTRSVSSLDSGQIGILIR